MRSPTFIAVASCLSLSLPATQGQVAQARLLEPTSYDTPSNCQDTDFELPTTLLEIWEEQVLPLYISPEIYTAFVALKDGWTPGLASTETPIVVRIAHLVDTIDWNCAAMYSLTWLDALTKDDPLLRSPVSHENITFHGSTPRLLCMVHAWAAVVNEWQPDAFPTLYGILGAFEFEDLSFEFNSDVDAAFDLVTGEPDIDTLKNIAATNCYKPKIMGAIVARQLTEYSRRDGYNMYGDLGRDGKPCRWNCRRYTDPTGYEPGGESRSDSKIKGDKKKRKAVKEERSKSRWKPMLEDDGRGYFTRQQHVTPHIGKTAKRAVLSDEDFESRILKNPNYKYKDEAYLVADRLKATAEDDLKKATIEFYDDKFKVNFSVLSTVASYGVSFEQLLNFGFGITSSEYDSILVAWKEKVA
jgi:hypothetical protein